MSVSLSVTMSTTLSIVVYVSVAEFVSVTCPVSFAVSMSVAMTVFVEVYMSVTEFDRVCDSTCLFPLLFPRQCQWLCPWPSSCPWLQSRIKVIWGPKLDTIVGPYTHPSLPSLSDPVNLTGVWGITIEKVWIANAIGEFQRHNQVKISEGQIEVEAQTYGAKRPKIEDKAWTEGEARDRAGEGHGEGLGEPLQKICENWNFFLISLFSFTMRGVVVKPPKAAMYRGAKCWGVVFGSGFPPQVWKFMQIPRSTFANLWKLNVFSFVYYVDEAHYAHNIFLYQ